MQTLMYTGSTILIFGLMIMIHEFGHFIVARRAGMRVEEFALGFGPVLLSATRGDTQYSWRLVPIGGYVRIAGMEPGEDVADGFDKRPWGWRLGVIFAGCVMNLILAIGIFCFQYMVIGLPVGVTPTLARVMPHGAAAQAGLQRGDRIVAVGDTRDPTPAKIQDVVSDSPGRPVRIAVMRDDRRIEVTIVPQPTEVKELVPSYGPNDRLEEGRLEVVTRGRIGVVFGQQLRHLGVGASIYQGTVTAYYATYEVVYSLYLTVRGKLPLAPSGPVAIVGMVWEQVNIGWANFLQISALLSIWIGIFNLLPFPGLDGSRMAFLLLEAVRGRPIDPRKEAMIHLVGILVLLGLVLVITANDILQLWGPKG
jgi:regulator of sigma E protease